VASGTAQSALVVAVPEAEPVVGDLRLRLDPVAALGVPAHVTVLFPFVPARELDGDVLHRVAAVVADRAPVGFRFSRTGWFDDRVLWLAPDDDEPFRELTRCIHAEFPAFPPFEGAFDDVVPHLTVGVDRPVGELQQAEVDVRRRLPVEGKATEVVLLAEDSPGGRWRQRATFPLRWTGWHRRPPGPSPR
jgi:2'-5' RNA ligase